MYINGTQVITNSTGVTDNFMTLNSINIGGWSSWDAYQGGQPDFRTYSGGISSLIIYNL